MKDYKEVWHLGCRFLVNKIGDVYGENSNGKLVHRKWRYNKDGYVVVSGYQRVKRGQRSIQVHILVAKAFVNNPNPQQFTEVNHKDFNRKNPNADNLEWVSHQQNITYSKEHNRYHSYYGSSNPNYNNHILHKKYLENPKLAIEKQSRPNGKNGMAKKCCLENKGLNEQHYFDCQREAVNYLIKNGIVSLSVNKETIIKKLRNKELNGWRLILV